MNKKEYTKRPKISAMFPAKAEVYGALAHFSPGLTQKEIGIIQETAKNLKVGDEIFFKPVVDSRGQPMAFIEVMTAVEIAERKARNEAAKAKLSESSVSEAYSDRGF
jgi:hypothetical protein